MTRLVPSFLVPVATARKPSPFGAPNFTLNTATPQRTAIVERGLPIMF